MGLPLAVLCTVFFFFLQASLTYRISHMDDALLSFTLLLHHSLYFYYNPHPFPKRKKIAYGFITYACIVIFSIFNSPRIPCTSHSCLLHMHLLCPLFISTMLPRFPSSLLPLLLFHYYLLSLLPSKTESHIIPPPSHHQHPTSFASISCTFPCQPQALVNHSGSLAFGQLAVNSLGTNSKTSECKSREAGGGVVGDNSLGKLLFKEMVHFKSKDNLSLAQVMIFFLPMK